jgi:5-bromo-4-chloroindolyl phosphate hydrolysis protein
MKKRIWQIVIVLVLAMVFLGGHVHLGSGITWIFLVGALLLLWGIFGGKNKKIPQAEMPGLSKDLEEHYLKSGMTSSEIDLFRQTMHQAKSDITKLQENMNKTAKLKAIDLRHNTTKASKALFKELVKEPTRLHEASHFLYTHLPNLIDLTDKYIEINDHEIKNKQTYAKLEESAQIIDQLASLISQDYQQFVADDLEDIDVEISIAKNSLKQDNRTNDDTKS